MNHPNSFFYADILHGLQTINNPRAVFGSEWLSTLRLTVGSRRLIGVN